jgi:methyltransferase (TIGR00027 family)
MVSTAAVTSSGGRATKTKVALSGVSETMLVTLTSRAEDARQASPVLGDTWAAAVLDQLDYARPQTQGDRSFFATVLLRARLLDAWTAEFLNANPEATVLHLGCGLDSRALRLAWGPRVRWIDVDMPEVVALRQKLLPNPAQSSGDYRLVPSSVTESSWLEDVPDDRPTVVVMEGLLPYLDRAEARRLVQRICERFPTGQIMFDIVGNTYLRLQSFNRAIKRTGATMHFALDDERELESVHPKLKVRDALRVWQLPGREIFPWYLRILLWVWIWLPGFRTMNSYFRYEF